MAAGAEWCNTSLHKALTDEAGGYFNGATMQIMLCNADNFIKGTHDFVADIVADELADASYARKTLAAFDVELNPASGQAIKFTATNPVWTALAGAETVAVAYIFEFITSDALSPLWWKLDGANIVTSGGDVTVTFDATDGIAAINT